MSNKVEEFFITPLEAHFESIPNEGPRNVLNEDMESYDSETLNKAVEWLKRNRQSQKTFPAPKECRAAIMAVLVEAKQAVRIEALKADGASYGQKLKDWVQNGGKAVIIQKDTFEWKEWRSYFERIGHTQGLGFLDERYEWTFPSKLPSGFDGGF